MPGPFPGMDPWLEGDETFPDLHAALITYLREALNAGLPPGYVAITNTLVWVDEGQRRMPDVNVHGDDRPSTVNGGQPATLTGLTELLGDPTDEPIEEPYLEIRSGQGKRLVTAVEILSPSNKAKNSMGRKAYRKKQKEFRVAGANIVELDLLRDGVHTTAAPPRSLKRTGKHDYHVSVRIAVRPPRYFAAPIRLTERLPTFGIPLDRGVPEVKVDLQQMLDRAYDTGRYPELVDYRQPPEPPLTPEQQAWAEGVLKAKGMLLC